MASGNDPKLGVEFITTADPKGAQQAAEAIKNVGAAAKETAPAQDNLNKASADAEKADKKVTASKKEQADMVRLLKREFPELGQVIDSFGKGPLLGMAGAGAVVLTVLSRINQKIDEMESRVQVIANLGASFSRFQVVMAETAARVREDAKAWDEMVASLNPVESKLRDITDQIKEQSRLRNESENLDKAEALAAVEARTDLTPEQKTAEKAKIERQFRQTAKMRERDEMLQESRANKAAADAEAVAVGNARAELPGAVEATAAARKEMLKAGVLQQATASDVAARSPELLKKIREAENRVAEADRAVDQPQAPRHYGAAMPSREQRQKQADEARQHLAELQGQFDALMNEGANAEANAMAAEGQYEDALGKETGLRTTIREGTRRGHEFNRRADQLFKGTLRHTAADRDAPRARPPASLAGADAAGSQLERGAGSLNSAAGDIARFTSGLGTSLDHLATAVEGLKGNAELGRKVDKLAARVEQIATQGKNGGFSGR